MACRGPRPSARGEERRDAGRSSPCVTPPPPPLAADETERSPREAPAIGVSLHNHLISEIATEPGETSSEARHGIYVLLKHQGDAFVREHVAKAREVEASGGMFTLDGKRRRTLGGVFFFLVPRDTPTMHRRLDNGRMLAGMGSIGPAELIVVALIVMLAAVVGVIVVAIVLAKRSTRPPRP